MQKCLFLWRSCTDSYFRGIYWLFYFMCLERFWGDLSVYLLLGWINAYAALALQRLFISWDAFKSTGGCHKEMALLTLDCGVQMYEKSLQPEFQRGSGQKCCGSRNMRLPKCFFPKHSFKSHCDALAVLNHFFFFVFSSGFTFSQIPLLVFLSFSLKSPEIRHPSCSALI